MQRVWTPRAAHDDRAHELVAVRHHRADDLSEVRRRAAGRRQHLVLDPLHHKVLGKDYLLGQLVGPVLLILQRQRAVAFEGEPSFVPLQ